MLYTKCHNNLGVNSKYQKGQIKWKNVKLMKVYSEKILIGFEHILIYVGL